MSTLIVTVHSSSYDKFLAEQNYPLSPLENFVAGNIGGNLPNMRNDLLRRKDSGQGFLDRHVHAWSTPSNWKWQPDNRLRSGFDFPDYGKTFFV